MPQGRSFGQNLLRPAIEIRRCGVVSAQRNEIAAKKKDRLKKTVAELELDKLILKEGLDFLKPKV